MIHKIINSLIIAILLLFCPAIIMAATFTVTNNNDSGAGSLRQAIIDANLAGAGPHTINFAPAMSGQTIVLLSSLPQVTVSDVTIDGDIDGDGTGDITVDAGVGDNFISVFRGNGAATNMTVRGFTIQDTGIEPFRFDGSPAGITIEDIVVSHNDGNFINYGVNYQGNAQDFTVRNFTHNNGQFGWEGILITGTATNVLIDNYNYQNGGGGFGIAIRIVGIANDITIQNCLFDLDYALGTDDGDYGIYFNSSATNVIVDNVIMHDTEVISIYFRGVATDISITNSSFDNFDGWANHISIYFNNVINGLTMTNVTIDEDMTGVTSDGNYGIFFNFSVNQDITKNAVLTNVSINQADVSGLYTNGVVNNFTCEACTFTNNNLETNTRNGGLEFSNNGAKTNILVNNSTFTNLGTVGIYFDADGTNGTANNRFTNNTISGIQTVLGNSDGIRVVDFNAVTDLEISGNTIFNCATTGIAVEFADGVNITQNSIYNNAIGIDNRNNSGGNDLELQDDDTVDILSSVNTGVDTYDVTFNVPSFCTNCDVEFFTNLTTDIAHNGRTYAQTATGFSAAGNPHTVSVNSGGNNTGFWTTTLKDNSQNASVSEFGNQHAINPIGPATVANGIRTWYLADNGLATITNGFRWEDISGNALHIDQTNDALEATFTAVPTVNTNFHPYITFDGNDTFVTQSQVLQSATSTGTVFYVATYGVMDGVWDSVVDFDADDPHIGRQAATTNPAMFNNGSSPAFVSSPSNFILNKNHTAGYLWNSGVNAGIEMTLDGNSFTDNTLDMVSIGYTRDFSVGAYVTGVEGLNGTMSEVIVYQERLSNADKEKVQSYLGIKYGVTLAHNYTASDGTIVWDMTTNAAYNNNIVGLGKDPSMLDQRVSRSINTPSATVADLIVANDNNFTLPNSDASRTSLTDGQYILFGDDGGNAATKTSLEFEATKHIARIDKEWLVQNTNGVTGTDLQFLNLPVLAADEFYTLTLDADGDFSDGNSTEIRMSTTNTFENVTFPVGARYMTIMITKINAEITTQQHGEENGPINIIYRVALVTPSMTPVTNNLLGDITFDIADLFTGSATSGADYVAIPPASQVIVASGSTFTDFIITVIDDVVTEPVETVEVQITNPSLSQVLITTANAIANITGADHFMRHGKTISGGVEQPMKF